MENLRPHDMIRSDFPHGNGWLEEAAAVLLRDGTACHCAHSATFPYRPGPCKHLTWRPRVSKYCQGNISSLSSGKKIERAVHYVEHNLTSVCTCTDKTTTYRQTSRRIHDKPLKGIIFEERELFQNLEGFFLNHKFTQKLG